MIRFAGLAALGLLAAVGLTGPDLPMHGVAESRATRASPLRTLATPRATPIPASPFEVPGAAPVSLFIENLGADELLIGGSTPMAARVELHQTRLIDGRRVMSLASNGIMVPGKGSLILEPAASHLMLLEPREALVQGQTFPLTLCFKRAGEVTMTVRVRRRVDAAGVPPIPPVVADDLRLSLASAPPAPAATPGA